MKKPKKDQRGPSQVEQFRRTARELGCAEDEPAFDAALKKVATTEVGTDLGDDASKKRHLGVKD